MRGGTLFSGIGAPECASPEIDWRWCAEIDPFASAVHAARFDTPNLGDVTEIDPDEVERPDIVVFGSPCQSFSVAGKRLGLDDPRGNLALVALRLVERIRPTWVVFENVPGLLSSDGGRDFGAFLGTLGQCGYGFAYRILDAQHAGVPQRRRRVFVVGHLGDWRPAAAVLFERESLRGDNPPRREAWERVAQATVGSLDAGGGNRRTGQQAASGNLIAVDVRNGGVDEDTMMSLQGGGMGEDRGTCINATPLTLAIRGRGESYDLEWRDDGTANAVLTPNGGRAGVGVGAVAFHKNQRAETTLNYTAGSLKVGGGKPGQGYPAVQQAMLVRRLTPRECERLQGFPDDFTAITYRGKPAADGPRYRALGNSMAVPVVRWILNRIRQFDALQSRKVA